MNIFNLFICRFFFFLLHVSFGRMLQLKMNLDVSKVIVGGITSIFAGVDSLSNTIDNSIKRNYMKESLTKNEVKEGIRRDFVNGYLFSGAIDTEIYSESCVFTDPTLSFKGLTRFENNIKAIKPLIDRFLDDTLVILYDINENISNDSEKYSIKARWRMSGGLKLFWKPRIELTGQTKYTLDTNNDNRIIDYFETWNIEATKAILQLLQPSNRKLINNDNIKAIDVTTTKKELLSLINNSSSNEKILKEINKLRLVRSAGDIFDDQMSLFDYNRKLYSNNNDISETFLKNSKWQCKWSSKEKGFNSYNAKITQEFIELKNDDNSKIELCITNSQLFFLTFKLISRIELDNNDMEKINVIYQQKALSLFDIDIYAENIKTKNRGYWRRIYEDKDIRIINNDNDNIFVLTKL